ncbi:Protein CBG18753 [Caenorhabditis briggsae]|uniref:Protein CBG18753 n=1 Tax=Caenorhabditis briggsae TaxID=6238 RepID=A8XU22_CAEBR|nr:Protein CBG18753 [Caenorhabditis briggsae]CAP36147.2 Protein CBG18753 [Caenorhabditis briggsae]
MGDAGDSSISGSGTESGSNGNIELVMAEFLSKCMEVVAEKSAKKEEKVPQVGQKGLLKQAEANTKWINLLTGADESNWQNTIKSVVDSIRARNAELMLLDKNPNALKAKEQFEAIAQVSGVPLDSMDAKWIAMAQMISTGASTSLNRHPPKRDQFFRSAGSSYRPGGVRGDFYGRQVEEFQRRPIKRTYDDREANSEDGFRKSTVKCYASRAVSTMKAYAGENQRRINWSKSLPASLSEEHRFTLYLVDRAMSAGSSSLAKAAAAFKLANDGLSPFASQLVSDVIKAQRRKESESRAQPTQVSVNTVSKIVERNALVVTLSFYGLLRAGEASMLKWSDVHQSGNMLKLKIRRAKNDQLARGRETFCDWPEGSKRDCLLKRFRARASMRPGLDFVFQNILTEPS